MLRTNKEIQDLLDGVLDKLREYPAGDPAPAKLALEDQLAAIVRDLEPTFIGPTWQKDEEGKPLLPDLTIGWEILGWCSRYLRSFDDDAKPLKLTKEQARFILWWYAIDERGRFVYRSGTLQRLKGWGKDPLLAVICLVEFVGPCRFSHFNPITGKPVAKAEKDSLVQVAAVSQDQTKNTSDLFGRLVSPELMQKYRIQKFSTSSETIRARDGRQQIKMVTSSPRALEGNRSTFVLMNETHHWILGNDGIAMYETVDGNVTKGGGKGARSLAITNAYLPGEDSVAERLRNEWDELGERLDGETLGILYDSIESHPLVPMHPVALAIVVPKIRGDAVWLDTESIMNSIRKQSIPNSRSRRMWLNQIWAAEDALYSEADWLQMRCEEYLKPGDMITLGLDGGRTDDSTALMAIRVSDGLYVPLGIWEKDREGWVVPRDSVHSAIALAFRTYKVVAFFADVNLWEHDILEWHTAYGEQLVVKAVDAGNAIGWDMRRDHLATLAHERLLRAIEGRKVHWSEMLNPELVKTLRRHFLNVYRHENNTGVYFRKISRESSRKVDAYAALVLAYEAMNKYRIKGKQTEKSANQLWMLG